MNSTVEMLRSLINFDTTSRESNLELIEYVRDYLAGHDVVSKLTYNEDKTKANLFATIGPNEKIGGVVLSGHTDVVPVDGQAWSSDPFKMIEENGRLYGRGTSDMKGFIATALAMTEKFQAADLTIPIHYAFTFDEETTCGGAEVLVRDLTEQGLQPRAVVIGEPTSMRVVNAHKGGYCYRTSVTGHESHSSLTHQGVNAISVAAKLIQHLMNHSAQLEKDANPDNGFEPPWSTTSIGVIEGGTATNIVAKSCAFTWDWRPVPGDSLEAARDSLDEYVASILPALRLVAPEVDIVTELESAQAPLVAEPGSSAENLIMALAGTNETAKVAYGTEGPLFQQARMPVVVFGPGSIEQAHKPDEFIELSQIAECENFLEKLMKRFSTDPETR